MLKAFGFPLYGLFFCLFVCLFSEKLRPENTKGVASSHSGLASLARDLCCSLGPTLSWAPTSALPVLKFPIVVEKEIPHFCFGPHAFFFFFFLFSHSVYLFFFFTKYYIYFFF